MADNNKIIWITGAGSGIGKELVKEFTAHNKNVAASSRTLSKLEKLKEGAGNGLVSIYPIDVADNAKVEETYKKISEANDVECLINNAGVTSFKPAKADTIEDIQSIINVNLLGAIYTIKSVLPGMLKRNSGIIINIISVVTTKTFTNSSAYSASKAGLLSYTKVLREELRNTNIKIVNILPGATKTAIWPDEALKKYADRMMTPEDVAKYIYNIYNIDGNMVPEEVVLRPVHGDL